MAKVVVVYDSKYGNTKLVAETIDEGLKDVSGVETVVSYFKDFNPEQAADSDAILIGSPNHIGGPTRGVKKLIDKLGESNLEGKAIAVFDTYMGKDFEKAVKKMEKRLGQKIPALSLAEPGLSVKVEGMKGPVAEEELPKCRDFGKRIASKITGA